MSVAGDRPLPIVAETVQSPKQSGVKVLTRMFYIDDSGAGVTGHIVFSWIECDIAAWRDGHRAWLDLRRRFFADYRITAEYELLAGLFVNGRGRPSSDADWNLRKANRVEAAQRALEAIGDCQAVKVGTVYRRFNKARDLGSAKAGLYRGLIEHLDQRLATARELGLILMDGDGTDPSYEIAHRRLRVEERHIVEDPVFRDSRASQWVQMADLVAYCAYQSLLQDPSRRFMWTWYDKYLRRRDVAGGPVEL